MRYGLAVLALFVSGVARAETRRHDWAQVWEALAKACFAGGLNPYFFLSVPFPLRAKTLYGAPRFARGEVQYINFIKGLS